ncbi:hypothetical protein ACB098_04G158400 [Castanea mollissima]
MWQLTYSSSHGLFLVWNVKIMPPGYKIVIIFTMDWSYKDLMIFIIPSIPLIRLTNKHIDQLFRIILYHNQEKENTMSKYNSTAYIAKSGDVKQISSINAKTCRTAKKQVYNHIFKTPL